MKANRKFKEEEAVSAVIGVILMVAITVAIAATVYVYVSGMLGTGPSSQPTVSMVQSGSYIQLTGIENGPVAEGEVIVQLLNVTGEVPATATADFEEDADADDNVNGGDTISFAGTDVTESPYTVNLLYNNDIIGTAKFTP